MGARVAALLLCLVLGALARPTRAQPAQPNAQPATPRANAPAAKRAPAASSARRAAAASGSEQPATRARQRSPLAVAQEALASTDPKHVAAGLDQLAAIGKPSIVAPISARLRVGLPPRLALRAIETLAATRSPAGTAVLLELLVHRRPAIRAAAAKALGRLRARRSTARLIELLDDSEASVRAAAIEALGRCGDRRARSHLFGALDRGVPEAVLAVARFAQPTDVDEIVAYAKDRPFASIEPALSELWTRADFSRGGKLRLLASVGELGTRPAQDFLRSVLEKLQEAGDRQMLRAVERAMQNARRIESERAAAAPASAAAPSSPQPPAAPKAQPRGAP